MNIVYSKLILLLFLPILVFAQATFESEQIVIKRNKNFKAKLEQVTLVNLLSDQYFDGVHFKIVKAKSDEAIRLDEEDEELRLKAATTYYHLSLARDYFINIVKSDYVASLPKTIIRLELTNRFNELGHFANDNLEPQYNNALTVPAGRGFPARGIGPWDAEIWFRPSKKINIKDLQLKDDSIKDYDGVLRAFRKQTHMQTFQRFLISLINSNQNPIFANGVTFDSLFRLIGASVIMESGYQSIDFLNNLFRRKNYWLDSALVPEIIYHEYSHLALSNYLVLSHSTPVIEGMADIFASEISGSEKLATKIKKYNTFSGKKAKNKKLYQIQFETELYANTDFVFGLLWEIKKIIKDENIASFYYLLAPKLTTNSPIKTQLIDAIIQTCEEIESCGPNQKLQLLKLFNSKGI